MKYLCEHHEKYHIATQNIYLSIVESFILLHKFKYLCEHCVKFHIATNWSTYLSKIHSKLVLSLCCGHFASEPHEPFAAEMKY